MVVFLLHFLTISIFFFHHSHAFFTPKDKYLLACGAMNATLLQDGRTFYSDEYVKKSSAGRSIEAAHTGRLKGVYKTARVFKNRTSYTFDIKQQGRHWVRLYFSPIIQDLKNSVFSVTTDKVVLLDSFTFENHSGDDIFLFKEYIINVDSDTLILNFSPVNNNSEAFINGIEVVSIPDKLIPDQAQPIFPLSDGNVFGSLGLEKVYRINMGGPHLSSGDDALFREWDSDQKYLDVESAASNVSIDPNFIHYKNGFGYEIAPPRVYASAEKMGDSNTVNQYFNVSWSFRVDPGFRYFVRMHFCDIVSEGGGMFGFNAYINNQSALEGFDVSSKAGGLAVPVSRDFVANGAGVIQVAIGPSSPPLVAANAFLNGLEIMKMSNEMGSLDGLFGVGGLPALGLKSEGSNWRPIIGSVVGAFVVLGLFLVVYCLFLRPKSKSKHNPPPWLPLPLHGGNSETMASKVSTGSQKSGTGSYASSVPSSLGRLFTFVEIQEATNNFDEKLILGVGGFGKVYKGELEDGTKVAVKRGNPRSEQGLTEFQTEIEMLSKLRHRHLVSLIGYCEERCEMILVYEYMANGPLRSHLYGTNFPPLSWKQRLEICIGAAKGLHYLHTGAAQGIIHRDVKTTNILLDENLMAKVADFGLSKTGPALDQTHVSTVVKGSFGYLDPEYFRRQQLTEKSDVYSFGVVLMEVLCARPAINPALPREQVNIAEWAMLWQKRDMLEQIIDPHLVGAISSGSLRKFGETAEKCLAEQGIDRPSMGDVLWNLEYALQLHETAMQNDPDENSTNRIAHLPLCIPQPEPFDNSIIDGDNERGNDQESEDATTSAVFSQLVNPRGR